MGVNDPTNELVQPVVDHSAKIASLEEKQSQHEQKLFEQISQLEGRLREEMQNSSRGSEERVSSLLERIDKLEKELEDEEVTVETPANGAPATPEVPNPGVEFTAPEVPASPAPPEKERRGIRARRKKRKEKK